jgi:ATP-dependent 26S proteasome regulatory subunit
MENFQPLDPRHPPLTGAEKISPDPDSRHDRFSRELKYTIKARFPIIQIATYEEERALAEIEQLAIVLKTKVLIWSTSKGLYHLPGMEVETVGSLKKPNKFAQADLAVALEYLMLAVSMQKSPLLLVLLDPYRYLTDNSANPIFRRKLRDVAIAIRSQGHMANVLIISPIVDIPVELEKEVTVLDFPLPDRAEISAMVHGIIKRFDETKAVTIEKGEVLIEAMVDAALGLTFAEIENCLARSIVEDKKLDMSDVANITRQKQLIIRKNGVLEFFDTHELGVDQIGGLAALKEWLKTREAAFSEAGRQYGIAAPKGVLLTGVPGCGKSLSAKCVAAAWHLPLIRLDVGRIFTKWIGSSEGNIRSAIATAESVAPCVLWIDEIEKGMPRADGHSGDNGTSMRVFASFLTWLQEKTAPVFVFATANQIDQLPPEVLRKGRFDEIFFVDLPTDAERLEIIAIQIRKIGRAPDKYPLDELVRLSGEEVLGDGVRLSGAEIESWVNEALIRSFCRGNETGLDRPELTIDDFRAIIPRLVPLAKIRHDEIAVMRSWANTHAVSASLVQAEPPADNTGSIMPGGRRLSFLG